MAGVVGRGLVIAGIPVGDADFELSFVKLEVGGVIGLIDPIHTLLGTINARGHALHIHRLSFCHRLDYMTQVINPLADGVLAAFKDADEALRMAVVRAMGISPYDQTAGTCVDPALACDRADLFVRNKGIGLPRHAGVCFAA